MEASANIKDAGKAQFSPLAFLEKYLFRVELMNIMVNLQRKKILMRGTSVKCTNSGQQYFITNSDKQQTSFPPSSIPRD